MKETIIRAFVTTAIKKSFKPESFRCIIQATSPRSLEESSQLVYRLENWKNGQTKEKR